MSIQSYEGPRGRAYQVRVEFVDDTGRRKQIMKTFKRKKEAQAFESEWILKKRAGGATLVEPSKMTVAELLADWLESKRHEIDDTPFADYARTVRVHLGPALGGIPIQKLTAHHIQRFLDAKRDSYPEGRGARTVEICYRRLYQALKYATVHRWIERNEAALVKAPVAKAKRRTTWDEAQLARFLSIAEEHGYGPIFLLDVSTGVRRGEILGVRWSDINWEKRTMTIAQTVAPMSMDDRASSAGPRPTRAHASSSWTTPVSLRCRRSIPTRPTRNTRRVTSGRSITLSLPAGSGRPCIQITCTARICA